MNIFCISIQVRLRSFAHSLFLFDYLPTDNRVDPMIIQQDWRDPFPKSNLNGGFIGDYYVRCSDLPDRSFLKKGAKYRLLGGDSSPSLIKDPSYFSRGGTYNITRAELDETSELYQRLYNNRNYDLEVVLENDIGCQERHIECIVDTLRVVKVGSVYYEYVQRPCVQMPFFGNGKQIQMYDNYRYGASCCCISSSLMNNTDSSSSLFLPSLPSLLNSHFL